jgi:hypothetical protein
VTDAVLCQLQFVTFNFDPSILTHKTGGYFIDIYIDDIRLYSLWDRIMKNFKNTPKLEFGIIDLGDYY